MLLTKYYPRDQDDKNDSINRCYSDAEQGRIGLALLRIGDLLEEFPNDANVLYTRGMLQRGFLGAGLKARDDFEKAFHAANPGEEVRGLAACNVATLARSYEDHDIWTAIALEIRPSDVGLRERIAAFAEAKQAGADYHGFLVDILNLIPMEERADRPGVMAAGFEVALTNCSAFRAEEELGVRKVRATCLRQLDRLAAQTREMLCEMFPPEERLALQAAVEEMERAIALENSDAELWNFHAAWCEMLLRDDEAIRSADKSIALRPHGYAKPWINKAIAKLHLERYDEGRQCAQEAARQAEAAGLDTDLRQAQELASITRPFHEIPEPDVVAQWMENFPKGVALLR